MIPLRRPWTRQPQTLRRVNKGSSLARGLTYLAAFGQTVYDASSMTLPTAYGGVVQRASARGLGAGIDAANKAYEWPGDAFASAEGTIVYCATVLGTATADGGITELTYSSNSGAAPYVTLALKTTPTTGNALLLGNSLGGTFRSVSCTGGTLSTTVGDVEFAYGTATSGAQEVAYFVNGSLVSSNTASITGSLAYTTGRRFVVGEDYRLASRNANRNVWFAAVYNRVLSAAELAELRSNPWRLFEMVRLTIPLTATASGLPTLTGITLSNITTSGYRATVSGA